MTNYTGTQVGTLGGGRRNTYHRLSLDYSPRRERTERYSEDCDLRVSSRLPV